MAVDTLTIIRPRFIFLQTFNPFSVATTFLQLNAIYVKAFQVFLEIDNPERVEPGHKVFLWEEDILTSCYNRAQVIKRFRLKRIAAPGKGIINPLSL